MHMPALSYPRYSSLWSHSTMAALACHVRPRYQKIPHIREKLGVKNYCSVFFWFSYAYHVFAISVATVIGPTPQGDGEMPATKSFRFSKSASPHAFHSTKVDPTSMTIDASVTISFVRNFGFPIAIMIISALRVISFRFFV